LDGVSKRIQQRREQLAGAVEPGKKDEVNRLDE
jgi:hypothetical protein